jgi:hypothetical protein
MDSGFATIHNAIVTVNFSSKASTSTDWRLGHRLTAR